MPLVVVKFHLSVLKYKVECLFVCLLPINSARSLVVFFVLLLGVGALDMVGYQVKDLAVYWNDCFRRIFVHQSHESVKELPYYCNELPFEYMYDLFRWKFLIGVVNVPNRLSVLYE